MSEVEDIECGTGGRVEHGRKREVYRNGIGSDMRL